MYIPGLMHQDVQKDLLRFTMVGSVDDGKSTLVGRLLHDAQGVYEDQLASVRKASAYQVTQGEEIDFSLITDGLKAEREQKITIDVAYRYFSTPRRNFIIADTPGHEQYTRNMATGASLANVAVVLVDARHGVLLQSKRHAFIAALFGVSHMVVLVNKMDLVGYAEEIFERIRADFTAVMTRLEVPEVTFIPVSALRGDNIVRRGSNMPWYQGSTFLNYLETVHVASSRNLIDLRFPVQYVVRPNPNFRGYCGSAASGLVRRGDDVFSLPSRQRTRIKAILTHDGELEEAFPSQPVTLELEDNISLGRGDMLVHPHNLPKVSSRVEVMLVWMDEEAGSPGKPFLVKQTTRTVPAILGEIHYRVDIDSLHRKPADSLALNDVGRAVLELHQPLLWDTYSRNKSTGSLILIDRMTNRTVAAGTIIEREPCPSQVQLPHSASTTPAASVTRHRGQVSSPDRERLLGQRGCVVWLTGLSGSGKSTIAYALERRLIESGRLAYVLDGDNLRHGLCADLGFSQEDRAENIRRLGEVAALMVDAGIIVVTAFISPYIADRENARRLIPQGRFLEVFLDVPLDVCEGRDPKGLYRKARSGLLPGFTGIDSPYERPTVPELRLPAHTMSLSEAVSRIESLLQDVSPQVGY